MSDLGGCDRCSSRHPSSGAKEASVTDTIGRQGEIPWNPGQGGLPRQKHWQLVFPESVVPPPPAPRALCWNVGIDDSHPTYQKPSRGQLTTSVSITHIGGGGGAGGGTQLSYVPREGLRAQEIGVCPVVKKYSEREVLEAYFMGFKDTGSCAQERKG